MKHIKGSRILVQLDHPYFFHNPQTPTLDSPVHKIIVCMAIKYVVKAELHVFQVLSEIYFLPWLVNHYAILCCYCDDVHFLGSNV